MEALQKEAPAKEGKIWNRNFVLVCMANFFIFLGFQMTLPTIPLFVKELGGGDQLIGFVVGIFTFSALLIRPYAGHALETRGRGFIFIVGLTIFVLAMGAFAFAASIFLLFVFRIIQGFGWGLSTTAGGTVATDIIPPERRGEGLGYFGLSSNIALAFGPSLGLTLAGMISFTQVFLLCSVFGLISILLASRIQFKKVEQSEHRTTTLKFDIFEKSALHPSILLFFITFTFGGITTFLPLHSLENEVTGIELYFLFFAIFLMVSRTISGRLYDRKGHLYVFLPGAFLIFLAMLCLAWLPNTFVLIIAASLYGLGFGGVQPALQSWAVEKAKANRKGMANATFFSFFDLGVGCGAIIFGFIALFSYEMIYVSASISIILAMILYIYLYRKAKKIENE